MATVVVVGLGPGDPDHVTTATVREIERIPTRFVRTWRHPSAALVAGATSFDAFYETADSFDAVYDAIVDALVAAAAEHGEVLYAVPGSPTVLERSVERLRSDGRVDTVIHPAISFLDVAWARLGVDPIEAGVRLVDGHAFATASAAERGPLLVAHCHAPHVLAEVKLAVDDDADQPPVVVLHHLGLPDEQVVEVAWNELDRFPADHLTALWVPSLAAPVGQELVRFHELVRTLRVRCPWDAEQTHLSLTRHLLEETYEVLEAIEELDGDHGYEHLEDELGDLLFQVFFHSVLGAEAGQFTIADVARGIHDKLVRRHPHVFADVEVSGADDVVANWEQIKKAEKGVASVMDGIAGNLPSLLYATKVQKKAGSVGFDWPDVNGALDKVPEELAELVEAIGASDDAAVRDEVGDLLFAVANVARKLGVDPEAALRGATAKFRTRFSRVEALASQREIALDTAGLEVLDALWDEVKGVLAREGDLP